LRIIHVQNAIWARKFLLSKFNITHNHNEKGTAFSRWAMYDKPQKRAGRPVLNAKPFRVDKDPWRRVWRTGFGVDYLRYFTPEHILQAAALPDAPASVDTAHEFKLLELNQWRENDEGNSYAVHGYDVFVQRLSVYVQRNMDGAGLVEDDWDDVPNPYVREEARRMSVGLGVTQDKEMREKEMKAVLDKFDNSEFGRKI
jgi:hypothetical protein